MAQTVTFDIHLATDIIVPSLADKLKAMGFSQDDFIGGISGIAKRFHLSKHLTNRDLFTQSWEEVVTLLSNSSESEFYGYAEAEVISAQRISHINWKPFELGVQLPFGRLLHEECPVGMRKDFDFHVTVDLSSLDTRLQDILENAINFYHVDISKPSGRIVRVYTFQPMGIKESPHIYYQLLLNYLTEAGGFEGKVQLEATYAYSRFPLTSSVPPIVRKMPPILIGTNEEPS